MLKKLRETAAEKRARQRTPDAQMELVEHLAELRTRIFRSIIYVVAGMALTYGLFNSLFQLLWNPIAPTLTHVEGKPVFSGAMEPFLLRMQICLIGGLTAAFPFVIYELWGFIAPALTPEERKPVTYLAPFSVLLFLAGVGTAYACLPATYSWAMSYADDLGVPVGVYLNPGQYILLSVKILLAFGIAFQLPLILLFLAWIGLINADLMTQYWRHATVVIAVVAAVLTPSNDPLTMLMMAVPMAGLYLLSIGLVRAFQPKEDGSRKPSMGSLLLVSLAPVALLGAVSFWLYRTHALVLKPYQQTQTQQVQQIERTQAQQAAAQQSQQQKQVTLEEQVLLLRQQLEQQQELMRQMQQQLNGLRPQGAAPAIPPATPPQTVPQAVPGAPTAAPVAAPTNRPSL